jgi:hypothetical protein
VSTARFEVRGKLDGAGADKDGQVLIDRDTNSFIVRPHRSRTTYSLPLDVVATWVCQQTLAAQVREEKLARKAGREAK